MCEDNQCVICNEVTDQRVRALVAEVAEAILASGGNIASMRVSDCWSELPAGSCARQHLESGREPALYHHDTDTIYVRPSHSDMTTVLGARFVLAHEFGHGHRTRTATAIPVADTNDKPTEDFLVDRLVVLCWGFSVSPGRLEEIGPRLEGKYMQLLAEPDDCTARDMARDLAQRYFQERMGLG